MITKNRTFDGQVRVPHSGFKGEGLFVSLSTFVSKDMTFVIKQIPCWGVDLSNIRGNNNISFN